jgi:hypothetical protein
MRKIIFQMMIPVDGFFEGPTEAFNSGNTMLFLSALQKLTGNRIIMMDSVA